MAAPKKCQNCGQAPAKVHLKKWENNIETDVSLCESCAEERGFAPGGGKKSGLVQTLGDMLEGMEGVGEGTVGSVQCRICGLLYSTFRQTGRLGCPQCYVAFEKQLKPLLRRVHGAVRHTGKSPAGDDAHATRRKELRRLQEEMERAVDKEEFERAAALRDEIRSLKTVAPAPENGSSKSGAAGAGGKGTGTKAAGGKAEGGSG
jgi:protein arginine kinase activator